VVCVGEWAARGRWRRRGKGVSGVCGGVGSEGQVEKERGGRESGVCGGSGQRGAGREGEGRA